MRVVGPDITFAPPQTIVGAGGGGAPAGPGSVFTPVTRLKFHEHGAVPNVATRKYVSVATGPLPFSRITEEDGVLVVRRNESMRKLMEGDTPCI